MFLLVFRDKGRESDRDIETLMKEEHHHLAVSCKTPTGDRAYTLGMCPDWELKLATYWFLGQCSTAEPHWPSQCILLLKNKLKSKGRYHNLPLLERKK